MFNKIINFLMSPIRWLVIHYFGFIFYLNLVIVKDKLSHKNKTRIYILMYHRIINGEKSKISYCLKSLFVTKRDFESQVKYFSKKYSIISLDNILSYLKGKIKLPARSFVITIDDGYRDNYLNAYPILKKYNLPATIFLVTDYIGKNKVFWWDKIVFILKNNNLSQLCAKLDWYLYPKEILKKIHQLIQATGKRKDNLVERIVGNLTELKQFHREQIVKDLMKKSNISLDLVQKLNPILTWTEIKKMKSDLITFGSHTKSHPLLTQLGDNQLKEEIYNSKLEIEKKLNKKILFFAYPYGESNKTIKKMVKRAGYLAAFSTGNKRKEDSFNIKRIMVWG